MVEISRAQELKSLERMVKISRAQESGMDGDKDGQDLELKRCNERKREAGLSPMETEGVWVCRVSGPQGC